MFPGCLQDGKKKAEIFLLPGSDMLWLIILVMPFFLLQQSHFIIITQAYSSSSHFDPQFALSALWISVHFSRHRVAVLL